jgi:hypothetical protein
MDEQELGPLAKARARLSEARANHRDLLPSTRDVVALQRGEQTSTALPRAQIQAAIKRDVQRRLDLARRKRERAEREAFAARRALRLVRVRQEQLYPECVLAPGPLPASIAHGAAPLPLRAAHAHQALRTPQNHLT